MATCKSCGAEIIWAKTVNGKMIPLDVEPNEKGNIELNNGIALHHSVRGRGVLYHVSHFVTCPNASSHRRK